jgi:predicted dehydrogenase
MPLRVAVAGLKHYHVRGVLEIAADEPGIEFVAIAESDDVNRRDAQEALGVEVRYANHAELLDAERLDVLVVCEEFARRGPVALDALKAGRHVFSDKPLCTREDELHAIASLAEEKGLEVGVDFSLRWMWGGLGARLRDGAIGEIVSCRIAGPHALNYDARPKWYFKDGLHGGVINDLLGHGVDYARWICQCDVTRVLSATRSCAGLPQHPEFETAGTAHYEMEGGASLFGYVDYLVPSGHAASWHCHVVGTEGDATVDEGGGARIRRSGEPEEVIDGDPDEARCKHPFLDFLDLLTDGTAVRTTDDALRTSMATLVAQRAAETGATGLTVPPPGAAGRS